MRNAKGLSAQQLADAATKLGHPLTRSQIANFELRSRSLDILDLLVIAAVCEVEPIDLLFPGALHEQVEYLPGEPPMTVADAKQRFGVGAQMARLDANLAVAVDALVQARGQLTATAEPKRKKTR